MLVSMETDQQISNKDMILFEIMLTITKYFFMSGADILVVTENWS